MRRKQAENLSPFTKMPGYAYDRFSTSEYRIEFPPDCVEVISRVRARRAIKKWKKELEKLKLRVEEQLTSLGLLEEKLISIDTSHSELFGRFESIVY